MNYKEYQKKIDEIESAREKMKRGQMSKEEFFKNYEAIPNKPLPENFEDVVLNICDYNRGAYGLREDGHLCIEEYQVFAGEEENVYVVFDTVFRGEADQDYRVVEFPVEIFSDNAALKEFEWQKKKAYNEKKAAQERVEKRQKQLKQFRNEFTQKFTEERKLRDDLKEWQRLKKTYLKEEVPAIIDSLIKRGILESEHKDDYIAFVKCDLI